MRLGMFSQGKHVSAFLLGGRITWLNCIGDYIYINIAELQIETNQNHLLKNLEGSIIAWLFGWSLFFVTLTTVRMLLWSLKMLTGDGL